MVSQELQLLEYSLLTLDPPPLQLHSSHGSAGHGSSRAGVRIHAHAHMLDASLPVVMAPRDAYLVVWVLRHYSFVPEQETAVEVLRPLLLSCESYVYTWLLTMCTYTHMYK